MIDGKDAFTEWGINFEDGALSALMTPAPKKESYKSSSRISNGVSVLPNSDKFDEREITLPFHLFADTKEDFFAKYAKFCNEVLAKDSFELSTRYQQGVVYRLRYKSCPQFTQYRQEMVIFQLKVEEPNPTDRAAR